MHEMLKTHLLASKRTISNGSTNLSTAPATLAVQRLHLKMRLSGIAASDGDLQNACHEQVEAEHENEQSKQCEQLDLRHSEDKVVMAVRTQARP